ncbi:MAG: TMEM175 family protein [Sphingobacteriia bacterium]|jgi:uncharacterized membrane protein
MSDVQKEIEKEFELERLILFSDAVFAIAITLLIIEIKFPELPENYKEGYSLLEMFKPVLKHFAAFILSFFFIGISWARHLKLFSFLRSYDNGVIFLNLLNLFFVVTFPFVATGVTHINPSFSFPLILYIGNIVLLFLSNAILTHYIIKVKPRLSKPGNEPEKIYQYKKFIYPSLIMLFFFIIIIVIGIFTNFNPRFINYSVIAMAGCIGIVNKQLKKYKPVIKN